MREIRYILVNFPTNLGDTILSFPAFDLIKENYPSSEIDAIVSSKTENFLSYHKFINQIFIYEKRWRIKEKIAFLKRLRKKYDLMVDFKNSFLPFLLRIKKHTPVIRRFSKDIHAKDRYLKIVENLVKKRKISLKAEFVLDEERKNFWYSLNLDNAVFVAPSSNSSLKRYPPHELEELLSFLSSKKKVILLGSKKDSSLYRQISLSSVINLMGKTSFLDVWFLLKNFACICICVDSSILHLASYLNIPTVALFGPTQEEIYGPYSEKSVVIRKNLKCAPCKNSTCPYSGECMKISADRVVEAVEKILKE
ncbi:MAG: hypothetical protein B6D55_04860 [Candidatus Omnitrophica bacterium 4484_70.2]|nr:MAG: hypothetical protein B6D55_04860 [Candidatus Omnitrophica bacterium 4484_70.2]